MANIEKLQELLSLAKNGVNEGESETLVQIKKLYKYLAHDAFTKGDSKSYSALIKIAIKFASSLKEDEQYTFLTTVFDIEREDIPLALFAFNDPDYLTWLMIQWHDLDDYCIKEELDGNSIQGFLKEVQNQCLGKNYMPDLETHVESLKLAIEHNSLEQIAIHAGVIETILEDAYYRSDAKTVAKVLDAIYPIIIDLAKNDRYELISKFLELDSDEIVGFRALFKAGNRNLSLWHLLENCELEENACQTPMSTGDVQSFKKEVLMELGAYPALKTSDEILENYLRTDPENEEALELIKIESEALSKQAFLDNDVETYSKIIQALYVQAVKAYQQKNYAMLYFLLELSPQELEIFTSLVDAGEDQLAQYFIMQVDELEQLASIHSTRLDRKDTLRVNEFKQEVIKNIMAPAPKLDTISIVNKALFDVYSNPKINYQNKVLLRIKTNLMLEYAYQNNSPEEYINNIQAFVTMAKTLFYPKDLDTLIEVLDIDPYFKERMIVSFEQNDIIYAVYLYAQSQQYKDLITFSATLPHLKDFHDKVFEKLAVNLEQPYFYYVPNDDPIHHRQENVMKTWRSMIPELVGSASPQQLLRFKEQIKEKQIRAFRENDTKTYCETIQLAYDFLMAAEKINKFGHFALAYELDANETRYLKRLVEAGDEEAVKLFLIQSHELEKHVTEEQPAHHISPFLTKVMTSFDLDLYGIVSDDKLDSIVENINLAIKHNNSQDLLLHYNNLISILKQSVMVNDVPQLAHIIQNISSILFTSHRKSPMQQLLFCQLLELTNDEFELLNKLIDGDSEAYVDISLLTSSFLLKNLNQRFSEKEINGVIKSIADQLGKTKENIQEIIKSHINGIQVAVKHGEDETIINHLNVLDQLLMLAFLSGDIDSVAIAVDKLYEAAMFASEHHRTDLIIHHLGIDDDYVELLDQLRQEIPPSESSINLLKYVILESMEFENTGVKVSYKNPITQAFKKAVQHKITGDEKLLLPDLETLILQADVLMTKEEPTFEEMEFLAFHLDCHLQYMFEQEDVIGFSNVLEEINGILHRAKEFGQELALVRILNLTHEQRTALLHHLNRGDKSASLKILIDSEIEDKSIGLAKKLAYQDSIDFRLNVFQALSVMPPELDESYLRTPIVKGIKVAYSMDFDDQALSWLKSNYKNIDLSNEFHKKFLIGLAKSEVYSLADAFLNVVNEEEVGNLREVLAELRFMHNFNHHLNLHGIREVKGIAIQVEGGNERDMVKQLKSSVNSFKAANSDITSTIQEITVPDNADNLIHQLTRGKIVNIPVATQEEKPDVSGFEYHATNVTFVDDLCLIADRSRANDEDQGIIIFRVKNKDNVKKILHELSETAYTPHPLSSDELLEYLKDELELEKLSHIKVQEQLAGSCTWSSCAEMIHLSTAFAVMYRQNKFYSEEDIRIERAIFQAQNYHNEFIKHDALSMLDNYLKSPRTTDVGFDTLSLAMAYLKYQYHPTLHVIADKIGESGLIGKEEKNMAFEQFVDGFKNYVSHELKSGMIIDTVIFDKVAREAVTFFLENRIDKASELFDSLIQSTQETRSASSAIGLFASSGEPVSKDSAESISPPKFNRSGQDE